MELRNLSSGGVFGCSDEMGERLLAEGGYEKVDAEPEKAPAGAGRKTLKDIFKKKASAAAAGGGRRVPVRTLRVLLLRPTTGGGTAPG